MDLIRSLIGTRAMTEYKLANSHKTADAAIQIGKRPDSCHWSTTSAKVNKNTRMYQNGMNLPSTWVQPDGQPVNTHSIPKVVAGVGREASLQLIAEGVQTMTVQTD